MANRYMKRVNRNMGFGPTPRYWPLYAAMAVLLALKIFADVAL